MVRRGTLPRDLYYRLESPSPSNLPPLLQRQADLRNYWRRTSLSSYRIVPRIEAVPNLKPSRPTDGRLQANRKLTTWAPGQPGGSNRRYICVDASRSFLLEGERVSPADRRSFPQRSRQPFCQTGVALRTKAGPLSQIEEATQSAAVLETVSDGFSHARPDSPTSDKQVIMRRSFPKKKKKKT